MYIKLGGALVGYVTVKVAEGERHRDYLEESAARKGEKNLAYVFRPVLCREAVG